MSAQTISAGRAGNDVIAERAKSDHEVFLEEVLWFRSFGWSHVTIRGRLNLSRDNYTKKMRALVEKYDFPGAKELHAHYRAEMEEIAQEARSRALAEQRWERRR